MIFELDEHVLLMPVEQRCNPNCRILATINLIQQAGELANTLEPPAKTASQAMARLQLSIIEGILWSSARPLETDL